MTRHTWVRCLLTIATWLLSASSAQAICEDPFSNPDEILDFHLQVSEQVWQQLQRSEPSSNGCDGQYPYYEMSFRCGDSEDWLRIGVRRRRDRSETRQKLPLKLDFNRFVMGQRWPQARGDLGYRRLSLNSGQPDDGGGEGSNGPGSNTGILSAMLTEHLAWRLMNEELSEASNVGYATLTLHFTETGESRYQGLYVLIEDIDRTAVRSRFGADRGTLYKTTDPACVEDVVFDDGPPNDTTDAFDEWLRLDPEAYAGNWYERTSQAIHLDELFRQEALREVFANTADTILGTRNNYFALDLYGARRIYLPWDLDDMFRPQPQIRPVTEPLVSGCGGRGGSCSGNPLGGNTREADELRATYLEILCRMTNGVAEEGKVLAELNRLDALIRPVIAAEVPILWEPMGVDPLDASTLGTYASEVDRMQDWIVGRVRAVRSMIEAEGVSCPPGCTDGAIVSCDDRGCPSQRSCIQGAWSRCERIANAPAGTLDTDCDGTPEAAGGSSAGSGCGCRNAGAPIGRGLWACLALALAATARRRQRVTSGW